MWQWIRSPKGRLDDGRKITREMVSAMVPEEMPKIREYLGDLGWSKGKYDDAAKMFEQMCIDDNFVEFLTLPAYEAIA